MHCACTAGGPCKGIHGNWSAAENPCALPRCSGRALPGKRCDLCEKRQSRIAAFFRETIRMDAAQAQNDLNEPDDDAENSISNALGLETFQMQWEEHPQKEETINFTSEETLHDGRWKCLFLVGANEASVQLLETDAELALRLGKAATDVGSCLVSKEAQQKATATYVVGEERIEVGRKDRRKGGVGYKGERSALKDEATEAVHSWHKIQILSSQAVRVVPEQRTLIDDALDAMLEPAKLVLESTSRFTGGKTWRKYAYYGDLGREVQAPVVWVEETHRRAEPPSSKYCQDKQKEAWCSLVRQMRRRVLAGEILLTAGREYWRSALKLSLIHI